MQKNKAINLIFLSIMMLSMIFVFQSDSSVVQAETREDEYVFRRSWGGEGYQLPYPDDVAIGPDGRIYVLTNSYGVIIQQGERIFNRFSVGSGDSFFDPEGVAVDKSGNVYVADTPNDRIQKFTSNGTFLTQWGSEGEGEGEFKEPRGIFVDGSGNVYVADTENDRIQKFTSNGTFLTQWGELGHDDGEFIQPCDINVDGSGNIYVADCANDRIQKFTSNGSFITQWGSEGEGEGQFKYLEGIAIDGSGNVYTVESHNCRIQKFTSNGSYIKQWGSYGSEEGEFSSPEGIDVDDSGNVYVSDFNNDRIQKFTSNGVYLTQWGEKSYDPGLFFPTAIDVDWDGNVFVLEHDDDRVLKFTNSGSFITQWGGFGDRFYNPDDIAVDSTGNVYVADSYMNDRIQKFTSNGQFIAQWDFPIGLFNSRSLAVDPNDNVYVVTPYESHIQKFSPDGDLITQWERPVTGYMIDVDGIGNIYLGTSDRIMKLSSNGDFLTQWGEEGSAPGQFENIRDVTVDESDNVYVADSGNDRIQKFTSNGTYLTQWGEAGSVPGQFVGGPGSITVDGIGNVFVVDFFNRINVFSNGLPDPDPHSGLVLNGAFEESPSLTEWAYGGDLPVTRSTHAVQGSYALQLGDPVAQTEQGLSDAWAHTTFYVRPEWERPVLSFKYNMFVNDIMDYSDFFVAIQDGVGLNHLATVLRDGYQPCIPNVAPAAGTDLGWRSVTYDLSKYKGQHIRLVFSNRNLWPNSWGIWTYVDDVRVVDEGLLPPLDGPYLSYLPMMNDYHCDPVPVRGRDEVSELVIRPVYKD